ncbi:Uncharacterized protein FWK35_00018129, partial [Aphis craccivora]
ILGFSIHKRFPSVFQQVVHLKNSQNLYYNKKNSHEKIEIGKNTTFMPFFELCTQDGFVITLLYIETPNYYTFSNNKFSRKKQRQPISQYPGIYKSTVLGRVYTVHLSNLEYYYMRMILHHVRKPLKI